MFLPSPGRLGRTLVLVFTSLAAAACTSAAEGEHREGVIASALAPELSTLQVRELLTPHLRDGEVLREAIPWPLPLTGKTLAVGVAVTADGARRFEVDDHGSLVYLDEELAHEAVTRRARFGTMSSTLFARQQGLPDDARVDFVIHVEATVTPPALPFDGTDEPVSSAQYDTYVRELRQLHRQELDEAKASLRQWLADQDAIVADLRSLPMLRVTAAARTLRDARLAGSDVAGLDVPDATDTSLFGYAGHGSMRVANLVGGLCGSGPCTGGGLGVGIWEFDNHNERLEGSNPMLGAVATNNGRLWVSSISYQLPPTSCTSDTQCSYDLNQVPRNPHRCRQMVCVGEHRSIVCSA